MLCKNVLSRVIHTISGVIHNLQNATDVSGWLKLYIANDPDRDRKKILKRFNKINEELWKKK